MNDVMEEMRNIAGGGDESHIQCLWCMCMDICMKLMYVICQTHELYYGSAYGACVCTYTCCKQ
jgi:hypothetical protein